MDEDTKELGTMLRKPFKGNRMNITVINNTDNQTIQKLICIMDKHNLKSNIVFNHYGRPNKAKKELDNWFNRNKSGDEELAEKILNADNILVEKKPILLPGEPIIDKLKRADEILLGKRKI